MTKQSGIYKITHTQSGKCYVGSAVCIKERIAGHKSYLKHGKHPNAKLQHAWTKYGCDAFLFEVIEVVDEKTNLISREQFWMDALDAIRGFNIAPKAGSSLGRKATEETRKKLSEIQRKAAASEFIGRDNWSEIL